jgi:hypothetical protein
MGLLSSVVPSAESLFASVIRWAAEVRTDVREGGRFSAVGDVTPEGGLGA